MVSHTQQKSINPWISVPEPNLTRDMVSRTEQKSANLWISGQFLKITYFEKNIHSIVVHNFDIYSLFKKLFDILK
jgi:hypothetical protein